VSPFPRTAASAADTGDYVGSVPLMGPGEQNA
jgi:hypothetical protein